MSGSRLFALALAASALACSFVSAGCGDGSGGKPQSIASETRVQEIVKMREIFDKVRGNWDALSAEDKAEYTRLAGDEAKARQMWEGMANPVGATPGK